VDGGAEGEGVILILPRMYFWEDMIWTCLRALEYFKVGKKEKEANGRA
jgi:hypothetical protein